MKMKLAVLPGDGIGPEVMDAAIRVLKTVLDNDGHEAVFENALIGGAAIDEAGTPLPEETLDICRRSDAILLGAVGGRNGIITRLPSARKKACSGSGKKWGCLQTCARLKHMPHF